MACIRAPITTMYLRRAVVQILPQKRSPTRKDLDCILTIPSDSKNCCSSSETYDSSRVREKKKINSEALCCRHHPSSARLKREYLLITTNYLTDLVDDVATLASTRRKPQKKFTVQRVLRKPRDKNNKMAAAIPNQG